MCRHQFKTIFTALPITFAAILGATLHPLIRHVAMDESAAAAELGLDLAADLVTVPMKAGDVLLFNNLIPHR